MTSLKDTGPHKRTAPVTNPKAPCVVHARCVTQLSLSYPLCLWSLANSPNERIVGPQLPEGDASRLAQPDTSQATESWQSWNVLASACWGLRGLLGTRQHLRSGHLRKNTQRQTRRRGSEAQSPTPSTAQRGKRKSKDERGFPTPSPWTVDILCFPFEPLKSLPTSLFSAANTPQAPGRC